MKHTLLLLKLILLTLQLLVFLPIVGRAQSITNYAWATSTGTFTTLTSPTNPSLSSGTVDEGFFNSIPIGFDFWYMGTRYTTVSASTNGWLTLGASITDAAYTNDLSAGGAPRPVIAPLWDDLSIALATNVSYKLTGSAPSRVFTIQYLNLRWDYTETAAVSSFQANLYESTGKVEFIYRSDADAGTARTANIGITTTATGSGNFLSVNSAGTSVSSTAVASVTAKPASGKTYTFTPPVPTAPGSFTFSSIATTSMTLNWSDLSSNETGFLIYMSTDGTNYSFVSQTAAGTTSSAQSGLIPNTTYYWKVYAVSEGGFSTAVSGSQATPAEVEGWYNSAWLYRKLITIDYTKVGPGPHSNFPMLISRTDTDLQAHALSSANDVLFTSSNGTTKLDHEIESYISGTGAIVAWVEIPSLSSAANTNIYMYYGNAAAANQQNTTGTWNSNYQGVWHLNGAFADATSNSNNGINTGTIAATGKISNGRDFVRSDGADYITVTGLMGSPANVTLSAWGTLTSRDATGAHIINIGDYVSINVDDATDGYLGSYYDAGWGFTKSSPKLNPQGTGWHYFVYTFNDAGNVQSLYMDGVQVGSGAYVNSILYSSQGSNTIIGGHANGNTNYDFDGTIDEVRVSNSIRSAGWVLTEYNNQNTPSTFYTVNNEAKIYYSLTNGNWNTASSWSNTGHGGAASSTAPGNVIADYIIIGNSNTVTLDVALTNRINVEINSTGTFNLGINTIGGAGSFTLNSGGTLGIGSTAGITSSGATGNVQVTGGRIFNTAANYIYNGTSAQVTGNGLPATVNNLTINNSAGVTLSAGVTVSSDLTVTSGTFTVGAFSLAVTGTASVTGTISITSAVGAKSFGNLVINTVGTFTNNTANAPISLSGNLQNNGTFSQGTGRVTFVGATSNTVTGTAATTAFDGGITVDKGIANTNVLDIQAVITMSSGGLILLNGTFKLSSNSNITAWTSEISSAPYNIPSTGGLWVNGGMVSAPCQISFAGLVHASAGTLNMGGGNDHRFQTRPGASSIIVDGGTVNVAARLSYANATDVLTFTMSSGTFTVGSSTNSVGVAPFTIWAAASSFTMSGGTIVIVQSAASNFGYDNRAGTSNVTGGTIQIGNAATPAANTMDINSVPPVWNLVVNSTNAPVARLSNSLVVNNDVTISGGSINVNNFNLTVKGNWINNASTTSLTAGTGTVLFNGTSIQTAGGSFSTNFNNVTINNASGILLGTNETVDGVLTLTNGTITASTNTLTIGNSGSISGGSATSYIVTNATGTLIQNNIGTGGRTGGILFPVGTSSSSYTPMTVDNAGTADAFNVRIFANVYMDGTTGTTITSNVVGKTWMVDESVAGGSNVTLTAQWNGVDELASFNRTSCGMNHYISSAWDAPSLSAATGSDPYTISRNSITSFSPFTVGDGGAPLPIELLTFEATLNNGIVHLNWATATELNNDYFTIERSLDGKVFEALGEIKGAGTINTPKNYEFIDKNPYEGVSYYRLIQTDLDGIMHYSTIISIRYDPTSLLKVNVYPNPTSHDNINIEIKATPNEEILVILTDVMGNTLFSKIIITNATGETYFAIDPTNNLNAGVYYIVGSRQNEIFSKKLVLQK
jgi:hypothetical protein